MTNALEIRGLCKHYDGFSLENIDLTLARGAVMGLIGENGAGKTTLIKTVLDLVRPDSGEVRVLGGRTADTAVRERLGVVLEDGGFPSHMSAGEVDSLLGRAYRAWDSEAFASYLDRFGIDRGKKISALSKGMKMKLAIAAALSHGAELLILDEATSSVDTRTEERIQKAMDNLMAGRTSFVIAHRLSTVRDCDEIVVLDKGRVVERGTHEELCERGGMYLQLVTQE